MNKKKRRARKSNPYDVLFGQRLQMVRESNALVPRWTQQQMADALGLKLDTYQKYEHGARTFPKDLIGAVCQHRRCSAWYLVTGLPDDLDPSRRLKETGQFKDLPQGK